MNKNICFIDGLEGILKYRDVDINELIDLPYDAVSYLLIKGDRRKGTCRSQPACMRNEESTGGYGRYPHVQFKYRLYGSSSHCGSFISQFDPDIHNSLEGNMRKAIRLVSGPNYCCCLL